jgi:hypothetical protein
VLQYSTVRANCTWQHWSGKTRGDLLDALRDITSNILLRKLVAVTFNDKRQGPYSALSSLNPGRRGSRFSPLSARGLYPVEEAFSWGDLVLREWFLLVIVLWPTVGTQEHSAMAGTPHFRVTDSQSWFCSVARVAGTNSGTQLAHYFVRGFGFAVELGMLSFTSEKRVYEDSTHLPSLAKSR